jgi:hypothetical protein
MEHTNAEQTQQCEVVSEVTQHPFFGGITTSVSQMPEFPNTVQGYIDRMIHIGQKAIDELSDRWGAGVVVSYLAETKRLPVNHPDYMRLVVHEMD